MRRLAAPKGANALSFLASHLSTAPICQLESLPIADLWSANLFCSIEGAFLHLLLAKAISCPPAEPGVVFGTTNSKSYGELQTSRLSMTF